MNDLSQSWVIYSLREGGDSSAVRYIGLTTKSMKDRLRTHLADSKRKNSPVCTWIRSTNYNVVMEVVEKCPKGQIEYLLEREVYWIAYYRHIQGSFANKMTPDYLKNYESGGVRGSLGTKLSDDHRKRIQQGVTRHFKENGHKSVYQFWLNKYGKEEADRMIVAHKAVRGLSLSGSGNPMYGRTGQNAPAYGRVGAKHPMYGKPRSDESKLRISCGQHNRNHKEKIKETCRWCLGADLQTEIDKVNNESTETNDMG